MAQSGERQFDVVVMGATGFTGRLVANYLLNEYGTDGPVRWAIAGRNESKLKTVATELGKADLAIIVADSHDAAALDALAAQTKVVCSTVGPFAVHGSELVAACARAGTHYCDITGEVQWVRAMIDDHEATAKQSGARIVHCCGFDSIPSDLGTFFMHRHLQRNGQKLKRVGFRINKMKGALSGGTIASMMNIIDEAKKSRDLRRLLSDPYALNPKGEREGPDGRDQMGARFDETAQSWTAPFIMAAVNTRIVRRTNALLDYPYGHEFGYDESTLMGKGLPGRARATAFSAAIGAFMGGAAFSPTRALLDIVLPSSGDGPDEAAREAGFYDIKLFAETQSGDIVVGRVKGDRDPGYGSTCKMLGESAVCLAMGEASLPGGSWTPASAMGDALIDRLTRRAGLSFEVA
ncbi:MAG: short subunit dehydrogenase-like uncharacterized protein [Myxococcota bacterium]|jgi:short subunit dehydrogenase-like uncharacterized protein